MMGYPQHCTHLRNISSGRTPRVPRQPLYSRFPARSCSSANGRYPPEAEVTGGQGAGFIVHDVAAMASP